MSKQFVIGIIFLLCLSTVRSVASFAANTVDYDGTMCPVDGVAKTNLAKKKLVATLPTINTVPAIDGVSYVKDSTGNDNIEIRYSITGSAGAWVIEFKSTSASTFAAPKTSTKSAIGSTAKPVVKIFEKNVLVTKEDAVYTAYVVDPTADHSAMTSFIALGFPTTAHSGTNQMSEFRPLCVTAGSSPKVTVYIEGTDGSTPWKDCVDYTINPATPAVTNEITNQYFEVNGVKPTSADFIGLAQLFYNRGLASPIIQVTDANGYGTVNGIPIFAVATDEVYSMRLGTLNALIIKNTVTNKDATLVYGTPAAAITASKSITTTNAETVKYYSDKVHNALVVTDQKLVWLNNVGTLIVAEITPTGAFTGDDLKIYSTNRVSLAGDKAFALFSTEIVSFQIISNTVVTLFNKIALTGTDIPGASTPLDVAIGIACQCSVANIKRFTCFATTLACLSTVDADWSSLNCKI